MNILALDASTELCSAALSIAGKVTAIAELCPRSHSQRLPEMVDKLLADAGLSLGDIQLLAVGRGPGGFTGVRIGIGYAMGLALAANLPIVGVSTLEALAEQARAGGVRGPLITALDARMGEVYIARWLLTDSALQCTGEAAVAGPAQLSEWHCGGEASAVGSAVAVYGDALATLGEPMNLLAEPQFPQAEAMLAIAQATFERGETTALEALEPLYLRNNVVTVKAVT